MKRTLALASAALACGASVASAQAPELGSAASFAVLGGQTVTNTGPTVVTGDLGVSPGTAITGFPPGVVSGTIHAGDAVASQAQAAVVSAYNELAGRTCTANVSGDLSGLTLTPGVYCASSSLGLSGTLTLDAQGNPNAVFIFKIGSTLTTASGSNVNLINNAAPCNVFWQVGSSATLGTNSDFAGSILALTSITATTGASIAGRVLARNGSVTLDTSEVTMSCVQAVVCPTLTLSPLVLPGGTVSAAYSQLIAAAGGQAPYTFRVSSGTLPASLALSTAGLLAGTPAAAGSSTFTVEATATNSCSVARQYTLAIAAAPPAGCPTISLLPETLPAGALAVAYEQTLTASGGVAPYTFGVTSGTLPAGLTLTAAGVVAGTPTATGTATFTIRATDAASCFVERAMTMPIAAAVPTLPQVFVALLGIGLASIGYVRLRRRARAY
jgi:hypothetical protein